MIFSFNLAYIPFIHVDITPESQSRSSVGRGCYVFAYLQRQNKLNLFISEMPLSQPLLSPRHTSRVLSSEVYIIRACKNRTGLINK